MAENFRKKLRLSWEFIYLLVIAVLPLVVNPFGSFPYEIPKQVLLILAVAFVILHFIFSYGRPEGRISFSVMV